MSPSYAFCNSPCYANHHTVLLFSVYTCATYDTQKSNHHKKSNLLTCPSITLYIHVRSGSVKMQGDGNLVMYDTSGHYYWKSVTYGSQNVLALQVMWVGLMCVCMC